MSKDNFNASIDLGAGDITVNTEECGLVGVYVSFEFSADDDTEFVLTTKQARKLASVLKAAADLTEPEE